ncbi:hypothetical protein [Erwinia phyllosphaerae]|uniref:hypothetical protein n=1 Tax=Erwinia phyllosphaerae TaxID=2853256 RepID=UPI001FEE55CA|nr:hypothetical protein [Erwinia phyllosphaerae]MBV4369036.1 hypothetical protein [Erwinia phyllosphaerae]
MKLIKSLAILGVVSMLSGCIIHDGYRGGGHHGHGGPGYHNGYHHGSGPHRGW